MRRAGALDAWFGADYVSRAARQVVAACVMAVDGDDTALAAVADRQAAGWLMNPDRASWRVAPGPRVTQIQIWGLEPDAEPPRLRVYFEFAGRRQFADPIRSDNPDGDPTFVGLLDLTLPDSGPWRLDSGHVETLDQHLGYVFTSHRETAEQYQQRTDSPALPAPAAGPVRRYRVVAGFAEHDQRFGSWADAEVQREAPPTRYEAADLVWPAVGAETTPGPRRGGLAARAALGGGHRTARCALTPRDRQRRYGRVQPRLVRVSSRKPAAGRKARYSS
jgi:hypothetical protein